MSLFYQIHLKLSRLLSEADFLKDFWAPTRGAPTSLRYGFLFGGYFFREAVRFSVFFADFFVVLELVFNTLMAFFTLATFSIPVVRPPLAPAVQYAYETLI